MIQSQEPFVKRVLPDGTDKDGKTTPAGYVYIALKIALFILAGVLFLTGQYFWAVFVALFVAYDVYTIIKGARE